MTIAICDNEEAILRSTASTVSRIYPEAAVRTYGSPEELLAAIEDACPDLFLLDIEMPGRNGIELGRCIRQRYPLTKIIYLTGHPEYALDAFSVFAQGYLLKPIDPVALKEAIDRLRRPKAKFESLEVSHDSIRYRLRQKEILFLEKLDTRVRIYTATGVYECADSIKSLLRQLDPDRFALTHRSYIVNLAEITEVEPAGNQAYVLKFRGTDRKAALSRGANKKLKLSGRATS